jgi:hypothetical protein
MFGGVAILRGLIAALGAALFVGNAAALFRSRPQKTTTPTWAQRQQRQQLPDREPVPDVTMKRIPMIVMSVLGLMIFLWAIASLATG